MIGVLRPAAQLAVAGEPHRPDRPAGDAGDGRQRRLRAGGPRRPIPTSTSRAWPARTWRRSSRAASRSTSASSRRCGRTARRCARPQRRHRDPRLAPTTRCVAPMLQRMLGRGVTLVSSGAGVARSVERALAARELLNPRGRGRLPRSSAPPTSSRSGRSGRASCRCRSARSSTSTWRLGSEAAALRHRRAQLRPRRRTSCGR